MDKIKTSFLKKYGVWEYILFLVGLAITGRCVYSIIIANFKTITTLEMGAITFFLAVGLLAVAAPLTLLNYARNKVGIKQKQ